jgi:hypothetical protein
MRILIRLYLSAVLGQKPRVPAIKIRKIGCGCLECNALDQFLMSNTVTVRYSMRQDRRTHLERHALKAPDLVTFHTERSGSPHTLVVTKKPDIAAILQWKTRETEAKTFLSSIGDDNMIAKIMGTRYGDVQKALDGTQMFMMKLPGAGGEQHEAAQGSEQPGASISGVQRPLTESSGSTSKRKRDEMRVVSTATMAAPAAVAEATRYVQNVLASDINSSRGTALSSQVSVAQASFPPNRPSTSAQVTSINTPSQSGATSQPKRSASYLNRRAQTVAGPVIDLTEGD